MKVRLPKSTMPQIPLVVLQMVRKLQEDMQTKQAELEAREYDIAVGGGVVSMKMNGKKEVLSVHISPEVVDEDDIETLEDLIVACVNEGIKTVETVSAEEMEKITGALNIPGLPGLF